MREIEEGREKREERREMREDNGFNAPRGRHVSTKRSF